LCYRGKMTGRRKAAYGGDTGRPGPQLCGKKRDKGGQEKNNDKGEKEDMMSWI